MTFCVGCAFVILLALVEVSVNFAKTASLELEKTVLGNRWDSERFIFRSKASSLMIIHMFKGDILKLKMCAGKATNVSMHNIIYSNDGNSDLVNITIDQKHFASFYSLQNSNWGHLWNEFHHVNASQSKTIIDADSHLMQIFIQEADCYGIELDKIEVELDEHTDITEFWCGYELVESPVKSDCMKRVNVKDGSYTITTTHTSTPESKGHISPYPKQMEQTLLFTTANMVEERETFGLPTVKPKSYTNICGNATNVNLEFSFLEIKNTSVVVQNANFEKPFTPNNRKSSTIKDSCKNVIWHLGVADKSNAEFSQVTPETNVNFFIHNDRSESSLFPGQIDIAKTSWILITYSLLRENVLDVASNAFLTVGLKDITTNITLEVRYYDWSKGNLSEPYSNLYLTDRTIMGWSIPATSISPLYYNHFYMFFSNEENIQIRFDFLRMDYFEVVPKTTLKLMYDRQPYKVTATQYVGTSKVNISNIGMLVKTIDALPASSNIVSMKSVKNIEVQVKSNLAERFRTVLSVHANGVVYPLFGRHHYLDDVTDTEQIDVSGFVFDNARAHLVDAQAINPISSLSINLTTMEILILDKQNHAITFQLLTSDLNTTLVFRNASMPRNGRFTLTYFSTLVSEGISTVDTLSIDDRKPIQIISNFGTQSGSLFKVEHSSLTPSDPRRQITIF